MRKNEYQVRARKNETHADSDNNNNDDDESISHAHNKIEMMIRNQVTGACLDTLDDAGHDLHLEVGVFALEVVSHNHEIDVRVTRGDARHIRNSHHIRKPRIRVRDTDSVRVTCDEWRSEGG